MAFTNYETKEIHCKIGYFGAKDSGKTANLHSIFSCSSSQVRSGVFEIVGSHMPSMYDFLPLSLGFVSDFQLKVHLFSFPTESFFQAVPALVMRGLDGCVFVIDSRLESLPANVEASENLRLLFSDLGMSYSNIPSVLQYNKMDLSEKTTVEVLRQELNPLGAEDFEAVATSSIGTMETLDAITRKILAQITND